MPAEHNPLIDTNVVLSDLIDRDLIRDILQKFSDFIGMKIKVIAEDGKPYMSFGEPYRFCAFASQQENSKKLCDEAAAEVAWVSLKPGEPLLYNCYCGLQYILVPLSSQFDNIGRAIMGPFRSDSTSASDRYLNETGSKAQANYALEKIPSKTKEEAMKAAKFFADVMDIFLFLSIKRLLTSRLHLDTIFRARDEIINQMENELVKPEDREELERLKHIF